MAATTLGRVKSTFAILGLLSIGVIYAIVTGWNPLPGWANWLQTVTVRHLATPAPVWSKRSGDEPDAATLLPNGIVVDGEGSVEVRDPATGLLDWTRPDSWAGVAGDSEPVVVVGKAAGAGFEVYNVASGVAIWGSNDKAGVWPYTNMILLLTCPSPTACRLRAVDPPTGHQIWSTSINGSGGGLIGFERRLADLTPVDGAFASPLRAAPTRAPPLIGLPMGGQVHVINTGNGRQLHVFPTSASTRVVVTRSDVISSSATMRGNDCYYTVTASSPVTGGILWQKTGVDLGTASGLGCEAASDPRGAGDYLIGIDTSGHDTLIAAQDGDEMFRAGTGERIVAMDDQFAIIRTAKHDQLRIVDIATARQLWKQSAPKSAAVCVAPAYVLVADPTGEGKLTAYDRRSGLVLLSAKSTATVIGIGSNLVLINVGRTLGPLSVGLTPAAVQTSHPFVGP